MALFKYKENENNEFSFEKSNFVTIMGKGIKRISSNIYNLNRNDYTTINYMSFQNIDFKKIPSRINFVYNENINIFLCNTVEQELSFLLTNMEYSMAKSKELIADYLQKYKINIIKDCNPNIISLSEKIKLKIILCFLTKPKVIVLDNILEFLDYNDKNFVVRELKKFVKTGGLVLNFTNNIEESLYGNKIIITSKTKIIMNDDTKNVLTNVDVLKKEGLGLPFNIELCNLLIEEKLIDKPYLSTRKLVNRLWK